MSDEIYDAIKRDDFEQFKMLVSRVQKPSIMIPRYVKFYSHNIYFADYVLEQHLDQDSYIEILTYLINAMKFNVIELMYYKYSDRFDINTPIPKGNELFNPISFFMIIDIENFLGQNKNIHKIIHFLLNNGAEMETGSTKYMNAYYYQQFYKVLNPEFYNSFEIRQPLTDVNDYINPRTRQPKTLIEYALKLYQQTKDISVFERIMSYDPILPLRLIYKIVDDDYKKPNFELLDYLLPLLTKENRFVKTQVLLLVERIDVFTYMGRNEDAKQIILWLARQPDIVWNLQDDYGFTFADYENFLVVFHDYIETFIDEYKDFDELLSQQVQQSITRNVDELVYENFMDYMRLMPLSEFPITVYRGLGFEEETEISFENKGQFTSTSLSRQVAERFFAAYSIKILLKIIILPGSLIIPMFILGYPDEMEVVLSPNGNWEVLSVEENENGVTQYTVTFLS